MAHHKRFISQEEGKPWLLELPENCPMYVAIAQFVHQHGQEHKCVTCQEAKFYPLSFLPRKQDIIDRPEELTWVFQFQLHEKDASGHDGWYCVIEIVPKMLQRSLKTGKMIRVPIAEGWQNNSDDEEEEEKTAA